MKKLILMAAIIMAAFTANAQITVNNWLNYTACPVHLTIRCYDDITCAPVGGIFPITLPPAIVPGSIPSTTSASVYAGFPCNAPDGIVASLQFSCQPSGPHNINIGLPGTSCPPNINLEPVPPATVVKYCFPATCSGQCDWPPNKPMCITYDATTQDISIGL